MKETKTPENKKIIEKAELFIQRASKPYSDYFVSFSTAIIVTLQVCFRSLNSTQAEREHICNSFHTIRTSPIFHTAWNDFIQRFINTNSGPTFYQHVTQIIMNQKIHRLYSTNQLPSSNPTPASTLKTTLSNIDENALRYVAGYICHKITNQLRKSTNNPKRDLLLLFMSEVLQGYEVDPEGNTETWTNLIDRGGLTHVNDCTYELFCEMEKALGSFYQFDKAVFNNQHPKEEIVKKLSNNTEILHQWQKLTEDENDLIAVDELYTTIISEFVTVRGFYFAKSIVETYKAVCHKNLQKSKGLRKSISV